MMRMEDLDTTAPEDVGFCSQRLDRMYASMENIVAAGRYAGMSILVSRHGKPVGLRTFGARDIASGAPLAADTIFRIASMTKPITGVAMMILHEQGKWQLDDPISKFIPQFSHLKVADADGNVTDVRSPTMRELLTTTAGFGGFAEIPPDAEANVPTLAMRNPWVQAQYAKANLQSGTLEEMIDKIATIPLAYAPGTDFEYGVSHDIQGYVIERISGRPLDTFMQEHIFDPLDMPDTGFFVRAKHKDRLATAYTYNSDGELSVAPGTDPSVSADGAKPKYLSGGGGLYSTLRDYYRFATMLAQGGALGNTRILAPSSVELMTRNLLPDGVQQNFAQKLAGLGYGINVGVVLDPARAEFNSGGFGKGTYYWTGVYGSWWWNDPVKDIIVIGMTQQWLAAAAHVGHEFPAPDLRALSASLVYSSLVDPGK